MKTSSANVQGTVEELLVLLKDADEDMRIFAALQLGSLGEDAVDAVPALSELLCSEQVIDRRLAALTLGQIGPAASEAVPLLVEALEDSDDGVRQFALGAISNIEPEVETTLAA